MHSPTSAVTARMALEQFDLDPAHSGELSLVSLGVLHRIIWRAKHHNARGNREFANGNLARALGHYTLVFYDCLQKEDLLRWQDVIPEDFDFESCLHHDRYMLFSMTSPESTISFSSLQFNQRSHVSLLDEWDQPLPFGIRRLDVSCTLIGIGIGGFQFCFFIGRCGEWLPRIRNRT